MTPTKLRVLVAGLLAGCMVSCSTTKSFRVVSEKNGVAEIEAHYKEYFFAPMAVEAAVHARAYFVNSAKAKGAVTEIALTDAAIDYNWLTGYFTLDLKGRARYGKEPFSGPTFVDKSSLGPLAMNMQNRILMNIGALSAVNAGLAQASQSIALQNAINRSNFNQSMATNQLNWQATQLNNSTQNLSRSVDNLNSTLLSRPR